MRFVGYKNNQIFIVSDCSFYNDDYDVIAVPEELSGASSEDILENYKIKNNQLVHKNIRKNAKELKVALVSNWKMRCGIATYAENLFNELINCVGDYKLFIEHNDRPTGDLNTIGNKTIPDDKIVSCWARGEPLNGLIEQIKIYDPDIILIQHEFGLWPNACYWLTLMSQLSEYRIIVIMHSVFYHQDKTICEAAMPEIVVHLEGGKKVLKDEKKVPGKVSVIPHGCFPCADKTRLWNYYKTEHTIIQNGYGFEYKGYSNSLKTVSILKEKYSDVFFTALFSESPFNKVGHEIYYQELMELVEKLDIQNNVAIIRGYQSDETLNSYLRTNKVAIFPYISHPEHEVWGSSGAARYAMTKNIPIITSRINHFADVPSIKADTPEDLAEEIDKLFSDKKAIEKQLGIQEKFLEENTWDKIAQQYIKLFEE